MALTTQLAIQVQTTLRRIKDAKACAERYKYLRTALGIDFGLDAALPLTRILETNGREDVLWALDHAVDGGDKILRLWAADCAEHVLPIFLKVLPNDDRPAKAIKAARRFARGEIGDAARDAARAAAWDAAWDAARAAAGAAAWDAARAAAGDAEEKWQTDRLVEYLIGSVL